MQFISGHRHEGLFWEGKVRSTDSNMESTGLEGTVVFGRGFKAGVVCLQVTHVNHIFIKICL